MSSQTTFNINTKQWFYIYCVVYLFIWTFCSTFARDTLPHDVAEGLAWGQQWEWGYDKHPPLTAWGLALFAKLAPGADWPIYLFSQLVIVSMFYAVWRLASQVLPSRLALISVFLLQGIFYYNVQTPNINPDTMQSAIWTFVILFFYFALTQQKTRYWLGLGILAGLAFLTKYQALMLFSAMLVVLTATSPGRQSWQTKGPYLCGLAFLLIILPHLYWSYQHDFPAIQYAHESAALHALPYAAWVYHIIYPVDMLKCTLAAIAGFLVMLLPFYRSPRQTLNLKKFDYQYLFIMGIGPFLCSLLYSLITGNVLRERWNIPYFTLFGILAMISLKPLLTTRNLKAFLTLFLFITLLAPIGRTFYLLYWPHITGVARADAYIPASVIATQLTEEWHRRFNTPLKYVIGESDFTAYLAIYSPDKPIPFFWGNTKYSAWVNEADFKTHGGIFIWPVNYLPFGHPKGDVTLRTLKVNYPQTAKPQLYRFNKQTTASVPPIEIQIAFIPPQHINS